MGHGVHMKCSESTTILCTCSATRQNARMQQVRANIIGADNTIMLSLAISRRHDLEIQLPDLLLDDFDTIAIERIKHRARVTRRLSDFFFSRTFRTPRHIFLLDILYALSRNGFSNFPISRKTFRISKV